MITITWQFAVLLVASITILFFAWKDDYDTGGMFQGCMTLVAIAFLTFLWVLYGGIYWW